MAVETKSSRTVAPDFFRGLAALTALLESERRRRSLRRIVVYGGEERQQRTGVTVLPWSMIDRHDWTDGAR